MDHEKEGSITETASTKKEEHANIEKKIENDT